MIPFVVDDFLPKEEYDALVNAQQSTPLLGSSAPAPQPTSTTAEPAAEAAEPTDKEAGDESPAPRPALRTAVGELPRRAL